MATPLNSLPFFLASSFLVSLLPLHSANQETRNSNSTCHNFSCGVVPTFKFSFSNITHPECGLFGIKCIKHVPRIKFEEGGREYIVKGISYEETTVVIQDYEVALHLLQSNFCSYLSNITTPVSPFVSFKISTPNYTFLRCNHSYKNPFQDYKKKVYNYTGCKDSVIHYRQGNLSVPAYHHPNCSSLFKYPLSDWLVNPYGSKVLETLLASGFALKWNGTQECSNCKCHENDGGLCSRNRTTGNFVCSNPRKQGSSRKKRIVIGATLAGVVLIAVFLFLLIGSRYWKFLIGSRYWWKKTGKASNAHNVEEFLENYGSLALRRYTYSDLKKITNSFKDKLGQGGYGGVFKGTLLDGRLVAVKVLNESKGNGEEFINEVGSIGRTYHVNVVALLGFCSEGSKRALIYEFMPNGSLEKFIYSEKPRQSQPLGWEKLCQIAIGIARGLEYLHRGCNTRILHFDIKPHNILLDEVFCPKISDFGLAKLCPMQNSTISMLGARGTVGYIAPEVYCRNIGGVSYKSDVYSYGMMVLEMVGGRKNIDAFVENTSEVYFPHWIYKRLTTYKSIDLQGYLGLHGIETGVEEGTARKMILVGLWCIQTNPLDRPSMSRVVEMLEGSVDGLQMPPQPFLSSSP